MKTKIILTIIIFLAVFTLFLTGCYKEPVVIKTEPAENIYTENITGEHIEEIKNESGDVIGELDANITAEVETSVSCEGTNCFEEKFKKCEPATITSKLTDSIIYYYEIIGPKNNLCEIKSKYIKNINPDWENKEMICLYNNTKNFEDAVAEVLTQENNCHGELYDLMTGKI